MTETQQILHELIDAVKSTKEFNQYQSLLTHIKADPELYRRISDYHRQSLLLQISDSDNFIQENNNLQNEYADLQNNGLSNEFFAAEHQYCMLIRGLQDEFFNEISIETDFLEE